MKSTFFDAPILKFGKQKTDMNFSKVVNLIIDVVLYCHHVATNTDCSSQMLPDVQLLKCVN